MKNGENVVAEGQEIKICLHLVMGELMLPQHIIQEHLLYLLMFRALQQT